jgi:hypothetical protein
VGEVTPSVSRAEGLSSVSAADDEDLASAAEVKLQTHRSAFQTAYPERVPSGTLYFRGEGAPAASERDMSLKAPAFHLLKETDPVKTDRAFLTAPSRAD